MRTGASIWAILWVFDDARDARGGTSDVGACSTGGCLAAGARRSWCWVCGIVHTSCVVAQNGIARGQACLLGGVDSVRCGAQSMLYTTMNAEHTSVRTFVARIAAVGRGVGGVEALVLHACAKPGEIGDGDKAAFGTCRLDCRKCCRQQCNDDYAITTLYNNVHFRIGMFASTTSLRGDDAMVTFVQCGPLRDAASNTAQASVCWGASRAGEYQSD